MKTMRKWRLFLVAIGVLPIMATGVVAADAVKIGMHAPQTGFAAADGNSAILGAQLAVEQANASGGVNGRQIELIVYDDQATPKEAVPAATKLASSDRVDAAISGSYSGATRAAADVFQSYQIPYISAYAVHPGITRTGDYVFRSSFVGEVQGRAGAKLVGERLGLKKVSVLTLKNDFGKSLVAGFREAAPRFGVDIISEYEYSIKDRQFGPVIAKIKDDNPEAVYATGYFFTAGPFVSQLRAAGVEATVIGQEGYDSQKFIEIAGKAADGVIITTSLDRDSDNAETVDFIRRFEAKAGYKVDMVAASGHTAVKALVEAMRKAGSTERDAVRRMLHEVNIEASTGTIAFNALGEVEKDAQVQIVRDGQWRHHSVISDPVLLAPPDR